MHALIIEDESIIAMAIENSLVDLGFTSFDFAVSAKEASDAAAKRRPSLITSDVQLRPGCGISTVLAICKDRMVPVVFITGNLADVHRRVPKGIALGKPFSKQQFVEAVTRALG